MTKLRVTRTNRETRMIAFDQFLFIDKSRGVGTMDTSAPRSTRVWPVGGWNFDLANYDAFISRRFACLGRFYHWHRAGECSLLENCSPLYENAQVPRTPHCDDAVSASSKRYRRPALWVSIDCVPWLWNPGVKLPCASTRKYSEVCDLFRFFCHNVQFYTTKNCKN